METNLICLNGKYYRLATLKEIAAGLSFWTGQHYLVELSNV